MSANWRRRNENSESNDEFETFFLNMPLDSAVRKKQIAGCCCFLVLFPFFGDFRYCVYLVFIIVCDEFLNLTDLPGVLTGSWVDHPFGVGRKTSSYLTMRMMSGSDSWIADSTVDLYFYLLGRYLDERQANFKIATSRFYQGLQSRIDEYNQKEQHFAKRVKTAFHSFNLGRDEVQDFLIPMHVCCRGTLIHENRNHWILAAIFSEIGLIALFDSMIEQNSRDNSVYFECQKHVRTKHHQSTKMILSTIHLCFFFFFFSGN
jgi:hypothetical protein